MPQLTLTVYSRRSCPACEEMIAELEFSPLSQALPLEVVDIDLSPALVEAYGWHVPVLMLGDEEVCRHALDLGKLQECLSRER